MTILQKLQVRQSEIREKLNELLGNDSRSETEQGELEKLTSEGQKIEPDVWHPQIYGGTDCCGASGVCRRTPPGSARRPN